jgi:hypothetical protein
LHPFFNLALPSSPAQYQILRGTGVGVFGVDRALASANSLGRHGGCGLSNDGSWPFVADMVGPGVSIAESDVCVVSCFGLSVVGRTWLLSSFNQLTSELAAQQWGWLSYCY